MIRDLNKLIRYLAYVLELLVLFMLQETPGLLPSIFGARPVLLFPAVVAIAMLEPEVPALLSRMVAMQMAPQIRMIQNNDTVMSEKIQSTLVNTIPLWKSQMVLAIGVEHSAQAAKAQREVSDMTNQLLKKNAEALKMATVETAKESERGIVDIETLKQTNETLISTLDEVMRIQQEGRQKRMEAEAEMGRMENELKAKLLQISG